MSIDKWLERNTASLAGKTVAVTGTTGGLGKELCRYLCALGASLILIDRSAARSEAFRDELTAEFGASVRCINLDLEDVAAVKRVGEELKASRIDVFIHNAGAYSIPRHKCATGYDNVF
jgi:short-subunit dehydrogenase